MSEASKALAEVRGWLCDNLDASNAGHVCGMLSVVSRRVVQADELEAENAKLRELVNSYADSFERDAAMNNGCGPYYSGEDWLALANDMRIDLAECCGEL